MKPIIQKIITGLNAALSSTFAKAGAVKQGLTPKLEVYVRVHLQALAIGAIGGLLVGSLLGHVL